MIVLHDLARLPDGVAGTAATIGVFDGVHRGHRAVFERLRSVAEERQLASAVVTFDRHPALVVRPESAPKLLTTIDQKLELLDADGIDYVYLVEFDASRAMTEPEDFARQVFVDSLRARYVTVGEDFHFGRGRVGTAESLARLGDVHGFEVEPLHLVRTSTSGGQPVSSTLVRQALADGRIEDVAAMLGRNFELRGEVVGGDERGRTIGVPTANILIPPELAFPAEGVYAGWYLRPDGTCHGAAINLGRRPTFHADALVPVLEAHLLDFDGDLYGEEGRVRFSTRLRGERRFDGVGALVAQLRLDIAECRRLLDATAPIDPA